MPEKSYLLSGCLVPKSSPEGENILIAAKMHFS
jgi:hypothetical protein